MKKVNNVLNEFFESSTSIQKKYIIFLQFNQIKIKKINSKIKVNTALANVLRQPALWAVDAEI